MLAWHTTPPQHACTRGGPSAPDSRPLHGVGLGSCIFQLLGRIPELWIVYRGSHIQLQSVSTVDSCVFYLSSCIKQTQPFPSALVSARVNGGGGSAAYAHSFSANHITAFFLPIQTLAAWDPHSEQKQRGNDGQQSAPHNSGLRQINIEHMLMYSSGAKKKCIWLHIWTHTSLSDFRFPHFLTCCENNKDFLLKLPS